MLRYDKKKELETIFMLNATNLGWKICYLNGHIYIKKKSKKNENFDLQKDIDKITMQSFY